MVSDVTCEKLREIGAEMALGVLPGRGRRRPRIWTGARPVGSTSST
ncbi:hypothetical protein SHIRM173S_01623 [Streptomyces hirsutus]